MTCSSKFRFSNIYSDLTKQHWFKSYYDLKVPNVFAVPRKGPDDY